MIEIVTGSHFEELLPLIEKYQRFDNVEEISTEKNREFFSKFIDGSSEGAQFIYCLGGEAVAFATVYFTYSSTLTSKVAMLNDLYVLESQRKSGIAKELIEHCYKYGVSQNAIRLQWLTAKSNLNAQAAYNKIGAKSSERVFYSYATEQYNLAEKLTHYFTLLWFSADSALVTCDNKQALKAVMKKATPVLMLSNVSYAIIDKNNKVKHL